MPPGKTEIDVSADFLFRVRQGIRIALLKTLGDVFSRHERNIKWCFTIPAIWNDAGKAALRAAIIQVEFLRDDNDANDRLHLVTEPEATVLHCAKNGLLSLAPPDAVLIVDAGKGTVDLVAYGVANENPLAIKELTARSGDSCGYV